tara:strand:+ start:49 stop:576 length:528 start_codon:yes stop_codon:yes gene_type:complete
MIEVFDNFLNLSDHKRVHDFMIGNGGIDWKYNNTKVSTQTENSIDNYQFVHVFFTFHSCTGQVVHEQSKYIDIILPLVNKIPFVALHRIKANLEPVKQKRLYSNFHCDVNCSTMTTGIYYVNTNDGYTEFESGEKIMSVANRYVKFPSNIKHRGVSQIDTKVRCVLNLNYFEFLL